MQFFYSRSHFFNQTRLFSLVIFSTMLIVVQSCKKEAKTPVLPKTSAQLIAASSWKWTGQQFKNQDGSLVDQSLTDIQKSDLYAFKADGTFSTTRGTNVYSTGTWKLTSDTQLQLTYVDDTGATVTPIFTFTVTESKFVLANSVQFQSFDSTGNLHTYYGVVYTYTH